MPRPTLVDVLREIETEARSAPVKLAETRPPAAPAHDARSALLAKLAEALRSTPEPELTWESLYAVKEAGLSSLSAPAAKAPALTGGEGDALRKLAHAVRVAEDRRAEAFFTKNAQALAALRGLTLLRERTNA